MGYMTPLAMESVADCETDAETSDFALANEVAALTTLASDELSANSESADFEGLRKFVRDSIAAKRVDYTSEENLLSSFLKILPSVEVVSFDIFDTALVRYVDHPVDVFFHLEQHPAFSAFAFSQPLSKLRIESEKAARSLVYKVIGSFEVNLLEIYQVFCDQNGISRDHAADFMAAEEQIELRLCTVCAPMQRLYTEAVLAGKRIIFVSDTYHNVEFLCRLLISVGYPVELSAISASSATRKAKQSGKLFPEVLATLGVPPNKVLHIGDHPISDYKQAQSAGVQCILHPHKASTDMAEFFRTGGPKRPGDDKLLSQRSLLRGLQHLIEQIAEDRGRGKDFWWKFGYASVGPLTVGFAQWLEQALRSDNMQHVYFLLRDGELLFKVYQSLFADDPNACLASCLLSSRRAMLMPVAAIAPDFAITSLLAGIGMRPVREYLDRAGVCADGFLKEAKLAGFKSLDELIDGRNDTERLLNFLVQKPVLMALLDRSKVERESLTIYLQEEHVTERKQVALVDLGWSGTIHKSMQVLLAKIAPETSLTGYYMATFPESAHSIIPNLVAKSYLAHRGEPMTVYQQISSFLNLFETVYSSTSGSLLYFDKIRNGSSEITSPVFQANDKSMEQCDHLNAIHAGAIAFAEDYRSLTASSGYSPMPPEVASESFFRIINNPTPEEAYQLGGLVHCDNLGSSSQHVSARLRQTTDPAELLEDYRRAHWKRGALAMPTPQAARLRTLLWLMESEAR